VRFYQIPDAPIVTPEIAEQLGSGGPNWYCNHCDSGNKDDNAKCWNCGAEKGTSPSHEVKNYLKGERVPKSMKEAEEADPDGKSWVVPMPVIPTVDSELEDESPSTEDRYKSFDNKINRFKPFVIGTAVVVGLAFLVLLIYQVFFNTHIELVQVSGYSWTQNVMVQEYQTVHDSSWTTHPAEAYNVSSDYRDTGRDEKIHDGWTTEEYQDTCYETVSYQDTCTDSKYVSDTCTGTTDNGDGSFDTYTYECGSYESYTYSCTNTRQEPYSCTQTRQVEVYHYEDVYDYYYEYDIDMWITIVNYPTSGTNHSPFYFSDFTLNDAYEESDTPRLGQQQAFQFPGEYTVTWLCQGNAKVGDEGYFTQKYSLSEWELFETGVDYPIKVNFFNAILKMPTPQ